MYKLKLYKQRHKSAHNQTCWRICCTKFSGTKCALCYWSSNNAARIFAFSWNNEGMVEQVCVLGDICEGKRKEHCTWAPRPSVRPPTSNLISVTKPSFEFSRKSVSELFRELLTKCELRESWPYDRHVSPTGVKMFARSQHILPDLREIRHRNSQSNSCWA
jgi:hypothetical protein